MLLVHFTPDSASANLLRLPCFPQILGNTSEIRMMGRSTSIQASAILQSFQSNGFSTIWYRVDLITCFRISPPLRKPKQWRHHDDHGCKNASIRDINMTLRIGKLDSPINLSISHLLLHKFWWTLTRIHLRSLRSR